MLLSGDRRTGRIYFARSGSPKSSALVGVYSYGLYLIHQPYVIWLGLRIRPQPILIFLLTFLITLAILSAWGMFLEKDNQRSA